MQALQTYFALQFEKSEAPRNCSQQFSNSPSMKSCLCGVTLIVFLKKSKIYMAINKSVLFTLITSISVKTFK